MNYYLDITLLPYPEIPLFYLWEKVYSKVHLIFAENANSNGTIPIGVAFPEYDGKNNKLGNKLRIFTVSRNEFEKINIAERLSSLRDYVHVTSIRTVPENIRRYAFFKRVQVKSSNERMARRKAKREGISFEEALDFLNDRKEGSSTLPYIQMKSYSSDKRYRLMIEYEESNGSTDCKEFSTYGLSSKCAVPFF